MVTMKIKATNNNLAPRRTGGIPLTNNTILSYEKHYESLYFFFAQIQDYESLLMLRREPLEYFPSMNPSSIILHHRWRIEKKDTPLMYDNGTPVKDLDGNPIFCVGTWVSPENLDQCRSAISTLHKARNMIGAYQKPCLECIEVDQQKEYQGCRFHRVNSKLWSSGNPNTALDAFNYSVSYARSMSGYISRGDSPLTPEELKQICSRLLVSNSLWDFELYCVILISCRMFLREDEIGSMGYVHINHDISVIKGNDCVEGLAITVKGKADKVPVTLMMWFDHEFPEFGQARHLLAWLYLSGIKDGCFFPSYNFLCNTVLKDSPWDGVCCEHMSYNDVLAGGKNICGSVVEREGKFGAHSGRKTGYLFGVWGRGQDTDLMLSARHKTIKNALRYKRDTAFLLSLAKENLADLTLQTPKWRPLYCEQHQLAMQLNRESRRNFKPIYDLAEIFVHHKLGVARDHIV